MLMILHVRRNPSSRDISGHYVQSTVRTSHACSTQSIHPKQSRHPLQLSFRDFFISNLLILLHSATINCLHPFACCRTVASWCPLLDFFQNSCFACRLRSQAVRERERDANVDEPSPSVPTPLFFTLLTLVTLTVGILRKDI